MSARRWLVLALGATAALAGCGGDDGADDDPAARAAVKRAIDTTIARDTAAFAITLGAPINQSYSGSVDFSTKTDRFTIPGQAGQPGIEFLSQDGRSYFRQDGERRYEDIPAGAESPIANNPADSLPFLERDSREFAAAGERNEGGVALTCYSARFDAERLRERVVDGQEGQFDEAAETIDGAPIELCVDGQGLLTSFVVTLENDGTELETRVALSDHGTAPRLPALTAAQRPAS